MSTASKTSFPLWYPQSLISSRFSRFPVSLGWLFLWLLYTSAAIAKPPHKAAIVNFYGDALPQNLRDCTLCHLSKEEKDATPSLGGYKNASTTERLPYTWCVSKGNSIEMSTLR